VECAGTSICCNDPATREGVGRHLEVTMDHSQWQLCPSRASEALAIARPHCLTLNVCDGRGQHHRVSCAAGGRRTRRSQSLPMRPDRIQHPRPRPAFCRWTSASLGHLLVFLSLRRSMLACCWTAKWTNSRRILTSLSMWGARCVSTIQRLRLQAR